MKIFKWSKGRQNTGYSVINLIDCYWPMRFDMWFLRFSEGDCIPPHVDIVEGGKHYRINIVLWNADDGGEFVCDNTIYNGRRIKFFRSDISEHAVTKIIKGRRYVLSFGFVL